MIFGVEAPRIIYNHRLPGEVIIDLDYARIMDVTPETGYVEHRAELSGDRDFIQRSVFWTVRILVHLFEFADPAAMYGSIVAYKGRLLSLYLHRDGLPMLSTLTEDSYFELTEVKTFHMTTTDYKDAAILTFESVQELATQPVPMPLPGRWIFKRDPLGRVVTDPLGRPQRVWTFR